jgi:hypothetical protein
MILAELKCLKNKKIWKISWVKEPANDRNWIAMRKEHPLKLSINEERHEVTGIVLVPDQRVYRGKDYFNKTVGINEDGEFFMSADTIKEFAIEYMRMGNDGSVDHSQDENDNINDCVTMIESWLITTPNDKAYDLGYSKEDAPIGTWLKTDKVDVSTEKGLQLWKDIKNGVYRGFSVEGNPEVEVIKSGLAMQTNESDYFSPSMKFSKEQLIENKILKAFDEVLKEYQDELRLGAPMGNQNAAKDHQSTDGNSSGDGGGNATTTGEAESQAKEMGVTADYSKMSVEQANIINGTVSDHLKEFSGLNDNLKIINSNVSRGGQNMSASGTYYPDKNTMAINPKFNQVEADAAVADQFHPAGCNSLKSAVDHEIGHAIYSKYDLDNNKDIQSYYKKQRKQVYAEMDAAGNITKPSSGGYSGIRTTLSSYANTNVKEYVSEAWSEYRNNPHPREAATHIGKIIDTYKNK